MVSIDKNNKSPTITLTDRVVESLKTRRQRILNGQLNCILSPFTRFREDFVGIEQCCYYTITSFTKGGKSQFTSYTFIYKPLMFCYHHKGDISMKILYFPLEETPERIMQRFLSWVLFDLSQGKVRVSPKELRSTIEPLSEEVINLIESPEVQSIMKYFEEHIIFPEEAGNPTGIYKYCRDYAEKNGTVTTKTIHYTDEFGVERTKEVFNGYQQNDPNEYRLIIIDTINLIDTERGMTLKQSMDKLSEYCAKYLRNRYNYSPVIIQQQAFEQEGNEAFKMGRIRPSVAGLGDTKYTSRDSNIVLGLFSPFRFSIKEYEGYDITVFKDNIRFLEVVTNRDGEMGGLCPLYFDGAVCQFSELPKPDDKNALQVIYSYVRKLRGEVKIGKNFFNLSISKKNKRFAVKNFLLKFAIYFVFKLNFIDKLFNTKNKKEHG